MADFLQVVIRPEDNDSETVAALCRKHEEANKLYGWRSAEANLAMAELSKARSDQRRAFDATTAGKLVMHQFDFKSKSGRAYQDDNGRITLCVHSNLVYTVEIRA